MMKLNVLSTFFVVLVVLLPAVVLSAAVGDEHRQGRRFRHRRDLSSKEHYSSSDEHDTDYDHDAFLGEEEAEEFQQLSPEESRNRLAKIVDKIDQDEDGFVTQEEMRDWIQFTQQRYIKEDVERQWKQYEMEDGGILKWEDYRNFNYGYLDEESNDTEENVSNKRMEVRDRRKWDMADEDKDGGLNIDEFKTFLHPEDVPHMRDIVAQETLEDMDKDGNGKVSMEEFIADMYSEEDAEGEDEPDWVTTEKEQFIQFRDKDKDGFMDIEEVKDWLNPSDSDQSDEESKHLVYEADEDEDGQLSKEEILDNYELFVGSQATDYGEALTRHQEF